MSLSCMTISCIVSMALWIWRAYCLILIFRDCVISHLLMPCQKPFAERWINQINHPVCLPLCVKAMCSCIIRFMHFHPLLICFGRQLAIPKCWRSSRHYTAQVPTQRSSKRLPLPLEMAKKSLPSLSCVRVLTKLPILLLPTIYKKQVRLWFMASSATRPMPSSCSSCAVKKIESAAMST